MRIDGWQSRRRQQAHSQLEWREIAYREYQRLRARGMPVPGAMEHALHRATGFSVEDLAAIVILFEARFRQYEAAQAVRMAAIEAADARRAEVARLRASQQHLPLEACA